MPSTSVLRTTSVKNGFSLVEIITVLFVVSLGLVGILSLIIQNIQSQSYNKDNLIAYQLAQEGVELTRKIRDSNWRGARLPFSTILYSGNAGTTYYMDYNDPALNVYDSNNPDAAILRQDNNGFYTHDLSASTPSSGFSRLITITNGQYGQNNSVNIKVTVSWSANTRNYHYDLDTSLYNWK